MTAHVGIYIYDEVEVLDFAGPFEVFTTASRVGMRLAPEEKPPFEVFLVGETKDAVAGRGGFKVLPRYDVHDHPEIHILIIPGGIVDAELEKPHVISWIEATAETVDLAASVCTGSFLLARAGLLNGKSATTHWEDMGDLEKQFPDVRVKPNTRWVDEGRVVTSAGISAGIDMSLYLVSRVIGEDLAVRTARQMEFDWAWINDR